MTARVLLKTASRRVWLKHRRSGLGGSDVAAVLGLSPYATPLDIWLNKTGRMGEADDATSYAMRRGTYLERFLIAEYQRQYPDAILERPPALLVHPDWPHLLASLDHLAHHRSETRVVEVKTAGWRNRDAWWDDSVLIPDQYAVQILTYLAVTGLDSCDVVADVAGDYTTLQVTRNLVWEQEILPYLDDWWTRYVVKDTPPPVDPDRDSLPALNRVWVPDPGEVKVAAEHIGRLIGIARTFRDDRDMFDRKYASARVTIRAHMETATRLTTPDGHLLARLDARGALTLPTPKDIP